MPHVFCNNEGSYPIDIAATVAGGPLVLMQPIATVSGAAVCL